MKRWTLGILAGFMALGMVVGDASAQKVELKLKFPEGRKARYKNKYFFAYSSNRAELIMIQGGRLDASTDNEWRSVEEVVQPEPRPGEEISEGTMAIRAEVSKAASRAILQKETQTFEQYPYTFELFNDRQFGWRVTPEGEIQKFEPQFPSYRVERLDLITDLFQAWMPLFCPVLPAEPVGKGDTWTGERSFERPFASMDMMRRISLVGLNSTYVVKKVKTSKKRTEVEIEEMREVEYKGWMDIGAASLFLHGKGKGKGKWKIDATNGIVLEHKVHMNIDRPDVIKAGERDKLADIHAEVTIDLERKLEKLENE